jgi:hypothetical protein
MRHGCTHHSFSAPTPPSLPPSLPSLSLSPGIYASTAIDHMTIPRVPIGPPSPPPSLLPHLPPFLTPPRPEEAARVPGEGGREGGREGGSQGPHYFPSISQSCPRRFLSDVKVGREGGRKGGREEGGKEGEGAEKIQTGASEFQVPCIICIDTPSYSRLMYDVTCAYWSRS